MALLIVKAGESQGTKGFHKYDIVEVFPNDKDFGNLVALDDFLVIEVDEPIETLMYLVEAHTTDFDMAKIVITQGREGQRELIKQRKYKFDFDKKIGADKLKEIKDSHKWNIPKIKKSDIEAKA